MNVLQRFTSVTEAGIIYLALKQTWVSTTFLALAGELLDPLDRLLQVNSKLHYLFMSKLVIWKVLEK